MNVTLAYIAPEPIDEAARIAALHGLELLDSDQDPDFDQIVQSICHLLDVPISAISVIDTNRQWFKSIQGLPICETGRDEAFCSHVVYQNARLRVPDTHQSDTFKNNPLVTGPPHIRAYMGEPIYDEDGHVLGSLCAIDTKPNDFSLQDANILKSFARQVEALIRWKFQTKKKLETFSETNRKLARLDTLLENAAAGIVQINSSGMIRMINPAAEKLFGYETGELVGRNVSVLMPQDIATDHDNYLAGYSPHQRRAAHGISSVIGQGRELEARHKSGKPIQVHLAVSAIGGADQAADEQEFFGIFIDLTKTKRIESKLKRQQDLTAMLHAALTDYERLIRGDEIWEFLQTSLRELTDSQYALIAEVEQEETGPVLKVHSLTDLSWDEGSNELMKKLVSGERKISNTKSLLGRVFADGETVLTHDPSTEAGRRGLPDGHPPLHNLLALPIKHEGQVLGMVAISNTNSDLNQDLIDWLDPFVATCSLLIRLYRQMEEREEFTKKIEAARAELEIANEAKRDFLSSMSHELRTPLNSILGFSELLQNSRLVPLQDKQRKQVQQIHSSGKHLLALINDILDLAKIEAGKLTVSLEPIKLDNVVDEAMETLSPLAKEAGISLTVNHPEACISVVSDYTRLKQVLINLMNNAIKYNRPDGEVTCDWQIVGDDVRIAVSDTGYGIAKEHLEAIFEPFNRVKAEGSSIEGTGVGLALTRKIVEYMKGSICVESTPEGSVFSVILPLYGTKAKPDRSQGTGTDTIEPAAQAEQRKTQVVYVEDNPANQRLMMDIFEEFEELELIVTHDPRLGLKLIKTHKPALSILDIHLPGMSGIDLVRLMKADPDIADIPAIALSANAMPNDVKEGMTAGFQHYLTKPIDIAKFMTVIDALVLGGRNAH